jgi:hypothetical protein
MKAGAPKGGRPEAGGEMMPGVEEVVIPVSARVENGSGASAGAGAVDRAPPGPEPTMPNLVGLSLREALSVLSAHDVQVELSGRGVVVAQHPAAGFSIQPGIVCRLDLKSPAARR